MVERHLLNGFLASVCATLSACIARNSPACIRHLLKHFFWIQQNFELGPCLVRNAALRILSTSLFDKRKVPVGACRKLLYAEKLTLAAENALIVALTKNVIKHLGNAIVIAL